MCGAFNDCSDTINVPNHSETRKEENKSPSSKERKGRHKNKKTSPSGIRKPSPTGKIASVVKCSRVNRATCPVFRPSKYFRISLTNRKYQAVSNCNLSCSTSNLVYLITHNVSKNLKNNINNVFSLLNKHKETEEKPWKKTKQSKLVQNYA